MLRKATPRKVANFGLVLLSYYVSRASGKPLMWGKPVSISVEPTTACNLSCPECPSGLKQFSRPTGNMKLSDFRHLVDLMKPHLHYMTLYFQGEPFIHPDFLDMVNYAHRAGIYTATSTNAHFIDEKTADKIIRSGLDELIVSVDGITQETYEKYRVDGSLDKVLQGTENVIKAKKKAGKGPLVVFQFLVVSHNENEIPGLYTLAKKMGVDLVRLKTAQIYDYENGSPLLPRNERYSRYRKRSDGKYEIKNKLLNHCWRLWHSAVITWDGDMVPCCFDKDAKYKMGSLLTEPPGRVWHNAAYTKFRKAVLHSRSNIDICKNCTEGTRVLL